MNLLRIFILAISISLINACAITPAEKAAYDREHAAELLKLQVSLAQECDPKAALLMKQLPTINNLSSAEKKTFEQDYISSINNPTFQACYSIAWKSYQEQNQLDIARMQAWDEADELDWGNGYFFNGPFSYWP